jgi:hypothetical protein
MEPLGNDRPNRAAFGYAIRQILRAMKKELAPCRCKNTERIRLRCRPKMRELAKLVFGDFSPTVTPNGFNGFSQFPIGFLRVAQWNSTRFQSRFGCNRNLVQFIVETLNQPAKDCLRERACVLHQLAKIALSDEKFLMPRFPAGVVRIEQGRARWNPEIP